MSESETINNIEYQNAKGENLLENKKSTTDTDFFFNLIANPTKLSKKKVSSESSDEIVINSESSDNNSKKSDSSSDSSKTSKNSNKSIKSIKNNFTETKNNFTETNNFKNNNNNNTNTNTNNIKLNHSFSNSVKNDKPKKLDSYEKRENITISNIEEVKILTPQEIRMKKIELIRKLSEIKSKGYELSKDYDFNSSLDEMEYEYELLKSFADKRNGVKLFKTGLLQAVSVIEFLNDKYDPFDFELSGWSDHITVEADSWEDVLEEIYEKYKGTGKKMAPEIKLLYLLIASASAFHFTKSYSSKLPGLDSVFASNPGLLSKIINSKENTSSQFMTTQEIHLEKQKEQINRKEIESKKQMLQQQNYIKQLQQQIHEQNIMKKNNSAVDFSNVNNEMHNSQISDKNIDRNQSINKMDIKVPEQVKDILNRIHTKSGIITYNTNIKSSIDTQDELSSNNDRLVSDTTLSENNPKKKQINKKKPNICIK
jgi:hypothetical protein